MTEARPPSMPVNAQAGIGIQISLICAAKLVIAVAALAAQIGGSGIAWSAMAGPAAGLI
jgi:hypothetical protein